MTPMMSLRSRYLKPKRISLKRHSDLDERWVQDRIAEDPSLLGFGDLKLIARERTMPSGGKLDLLLGEEGEGGEFYEVEIQLGPTDPSHIIRTIEYWDYERRKHPDNNHVAVLVAEDITSRFLNVVTLLNRSVPILAVQMQAMEVGEHLALVFTMVVDESLRLSEEEDAQTPVSRADWEKRSKKALEIVDELFDIVRGVDPGFELKYLQRYIAASKDGRNFLSFIPRKNGMTLGMAARQSEDLDSEINSLGLGAGAEYKRSAYKFELQKDDVTKRADAFRHLFSSAYKDW